MIPNPDPSPQYPEYLLHCRDADGREVRLRYSPHTSELLDEEGAPVVEDKEQRDFKLAPRVSPEVPGRKVAAPATLKIQLGMACNYACSYCNQAAQVGSETVTRTADVDRFLGTLDDWLAGPPGRIEFWGGEPFLYFAKLKRLVPALRARFPEARFLIITNGSLIDGEIIDFIERYDIAIGVSHDGPGQHLRGPDPFDDPVRAAWIRELWRRRGPAGRMSFNVVFTPANCDVRATYEWFVARVGDPAVALGTEGAVSTYDDGTASGTGRFSADDYARLRSSMQSAFADGSVERYREILRAAGEFIDSLHTGRPSSALGQKCGMDREENLAVDLGGRVMTCQNTGALGVHGIGNVSDLAGVRLDTSWHWSHRECCNHCPVLQLCKGSCMYLEGELFAQSCENAYHYNLAVMAGALKFVAGLDLLRVEGDIRRPRGRRHVRLAIAPASAD